LALEGLETAAETRTTYVRERAWWSLARAFAARIPHALLLRGLHDPDAVVRIQAVRAFGHLHGAGYARELAASLVDPSWRVQEQAAESIRVLRGGAMTQHLTEIPAYVHVPGPQPDPLAHVATIPFFPVRAVPLDPQTAEEMLAPAHGPHPRVRMRTTEGNVYVTFYPEWAPKTVANFLKLSERGFFNNNRWFRIVPDFVVQTGEKDDKKMPGPGYTIQAEQNPLEQNSYIISMGLDYNGTTPKINSAGSEYYVTLSPQYHLDGPFSVFGAVSSGFDVLARLTEHDSVIRIERIKDAML
jgi:peptidyl-prolyl cis-trans isomerase B (cyclophilin B)